MAYSQAATVRKALHGMGLVGDGKGFVPADVKARKRAAGLKSAEAKKRRKAEAEGKEYVPPVQPVSVESKLVPSVQQNQQDLQTIQQTNVTAARQMLSDAAQDAARYMCDLVRGHIPDAPERLRLEAAKVILQSQGVTGEQSDNSRKDINSMSKQDLLAFIQAGTVELKRLQAERDSQIIDVSP